MSADLDLYGDLGIAQDVPTQPKKRARSEKPERATKAAQSRRRESAPEDDDDDGGADDAPPALDDEHLVLPGEGADLDESEEESGLVPELEITDVHQDSTVAGLRLYFSSKFGGIERCRLLTDKFTGHSKGRGFVTFKKRGAYEKCLKAQHVVDGNALKIQTTARSTAMLTEAKDRKGPLHKVFVGGLSPESTDSDLENFMSRYGQVIEANIAKDEAGNSKGFGFVAYGTRFEANKAATAAEVTMSGARLEIKMYDHRRDPTGEGVRMSAPPVIRTAPVPGRR